MLGGAPSELAALNNQLVEARRERDEALAKHCECSAEDACKFARERDEALRDLEARDIANGALRARCEAAEARAAKLEKALHGIRL